MSEAGRSALLSQRSSPVGDERAVQEVESSPTAASRRAALVNDDVARLTASMVPPPQPAWRRLLGRLSHFWLLVTFVVAWQLISMFGQRINPQLDVMMPPPTAVFSAAVDLLGRGVLFTHIFDSLYRVLLAVGTAAVVLWSTRCWSSFGRSRRWHGFR